MNKNIIIIFARNPELGKVKTRLAKTIGDQAALNIYKYLLEHTEKIVNTVNADKAIYYSEEINNNDMWDNTMYQKHQQQGENLGERMLNAFENAFKNNYNKVMIIGSDLFDLESRIIEDAFKKLDKHDAVIGPSEDGGYYLLGMKKMTPSVFKNKQWGSNTVYKNTINDLKTYKVYGLPILNDLDVWDDLKRIPFLLTNFIK